MDDEDDWFDSRDLSVAMGGSITIALARQFVFDRAEHFEASLDALERLKEHAEHRPVRLELELEAYFLSVFACLERTTTSACDDLQEVSRLAISQHDIRCRAVFSRAVKYLQLFEAVERIDQVVLNELRKYQLVRHAIAHGVGVAGCSGNKRKTVMQLPGIKLDAETDQPELTKEFCLRFKEFAYRYIDELERVTGAYGARAKHWAGNGT